ncbi:hypothetical protein [Cryobacterium tagatosivorans]|uniref:Uncharacterized protein n=1 Tax=Cryobacterium tagatosivorans TaxID=1259199 RepID=A0A4R8U9W6_9MICO|nr:hypothetical protein [Cryobacterium tagatosivorans]TFB46556.1 hypothetical protein E3O23_17430 [Cryobacterium tagatosivorans]
MSTIAPRAPGISQYSAVRFERAAIHVGLALARWGRRRAARRPVRLNVPEHPLAALAAADLGSRRQFWLR